MGPKAREHFLYKRQQCSYYIILSHHLEHVSHTNYYVALIRWIIYRFLGFVWLESQPIIASQRHFLHVCSSCVFNVEHLCRSIEKKTWCIYQMLLAARIRWKLIYSKYSDDFSELSNEKKYWDLHFRPISNSMQRWTLRGIVPIE